jgi:hypothetical protein
MLTTNNAVTTLAAGISAAATSLSVTSGGGALFPNPVGQQYFRVTLVKNGNTAIYENIKVLSRSTDNFTTILRGQEGTTALAWNAGDTVTLLPTAADLSAFAQFDDLQAQYGNYALDTGAANAYVVGLTPALTAHIIGMPIRWLAGHTSTGNCTFSDGVGALTLLLAPGVQVPAGTIVAGGMYEAIFTGTYFQLIYGANLAPYALSSALAAYALVSSLAAYAPKASPVLTGTPQAPTAPPNSGSVQLATCAYADLAAEEIYTTGTNGSVTYPNGFIENWGTALTPGSSPVTINFAKPFTAKVFRIHVTCLNAFQELFVAYPYSSLTGFSLGFGSGGQYVAWSAVGY